MSIVVQIYGKLPVSIAKGDIRLSDQGNVRESLPCPFQVHSCSTNYKPCTAPPRGIPSLRDAGVMQEHCREAGARLVVLSIFI